MKEEIEHMLQPYNAIVTILANRCIVGAAT
jgi:hypothetical protein